MAGDDAIVCNYMIFTKYDMMCANKTKTNQKERQKYECFPIHRI
ncbi:hypothetical protein HFN_1525 [Helicobacter fennelliae MRY12-0050]|uniref:Uncharacterized protein n=1 Tax=Helicobacter fennelliae MRY12-0050 TaxID=1325130 RepID=T1CYF3_9HELI|nr:hypothetical protein HFN_1525 [Helicobacter fennelliae MRY12-0050]